jgi:peroxin-4
LQHEFNIRRRQNNKALTMSAAGRLMRELKDANKSTDPDIVLSSDPEHIFKWRATVQGPADTPYHTGTFHITLRVATDYPMVPPTASFTTKIFHPNVKFDTGEICLDILKTNWTPAWTMASVCRAIQSLLCDPEASSPLNCDAGNLIRAGDMEGFEGLARYYTIAEAGGKNADW